MFDVVICSVNTGRVQRKSFDTWEAARQHADAVTEKKGRNVRVWLERVETPAVQSFADRTQTTGRSFAA